MRDYVINFFVWWYAVRLPKLARRVASKLVFILQYTDTLAMAQNLFVPLFQDSSGIGKAISLPIRVIWVWIGGMITAVIFIPMVIYLLLFAILPPLVIGQIALGILRLIGII